MRVKELEVGGLYKIKEADVSVHRDMAYSSDTCVVTILKKSRRDRLVARAPAYHYKEGVKLQGQPAIYAGPFKKKYVAISGNYSFLSKCHKFLIGGEEIHIYGEYIRHIVPYI